MAGNDSSGNKSAAIKERFALSYDSSSIRANSGTYQNFSILFKLKLLVVSQCGTVKNINSWIMVKLP
ncbi:hypothetical protein C5167_012829 [Papaver somniferum]|uniref:Uncharacterized protein n=1 Tax=Papaver somniferum TaxID=3469 RepID=A0A4Y7J1R1_PAPSO|nr:hypothetical protein C5167_012829 [Papaver somniferum]